LYFRITKIIADKDVRAPFLHFFMAKHASQFQEPSGWHHRNYLPHFDGGEMHWQFITIHLGDALPQNVIEK
jgi:hypothetical protein